MAEHLNIGEQVAWNWGQHQAVGRVTQRFTERVTRTIKGSAITRNADADNPAYLIEQDDGDIVLKSHSELASDRGSRSAGR